ncbi:MAG: hypothetical protein WAW96_13700, partial [Alphaproteobacteria bacterium]
MSRYGIALAAPSALYLPLYLAKVMSPKRAFKVIDFVYKEDKKLNPADDPGNVSDPLINYLLSEDKQDADPQCIMAVCDPFRALLKPIAGHGRPKIAGTLIQHMFFWLIDHGTELKDGDENRIHELFEKIVVAPRHMTGYAVACHYLQIKCNACPEQIEKTLFWETKPGFEAQYCRTFQRQRPKKDYAYLTWDMRNKFRLETGEQVHLPLRNFPEFQDCAMTGLVVNEKMYESDEGGLIDELIGLTYDAVSFMGDDPEGAAQCLRDYADPYIDFSDWSLTERYIQYLLCTNAFAHSNKIDTAQIQKTIEIRKSATAGHREMTHYESNPKIEDYLAKTAHCPDQELNRQLRERAVLLRWTLGEAREKNDAYLAKETKSMQRSIYVGFFLTALQLADLVVPQWATSVHPVEIFKEWFTAFTTFMTFRIVLPQWVTSELAVESWKECFTTFGIVFPPIWVVAHDAQ